ncbi:hypothetical protein [Hoylesella saccharolytica]|uniref:hypothetical protein n=1 Tax=Hoylesella saccharolytica TaxID=633701 RepID=UPI000ADFCBBD|nr:hypothetical protein [Hoylesella saccharolytica]
MKIQKNGTFSTCLLHREKAPLGVSFAQITFIEPIAKRCAGNERVIDALKQV